MGQIDWYDQLGCNVTTNLVVTLGLLTVTTKFVVTAVTTRLVITAVTAAMTKLVLTAVMTKLVVLAFYSFKNLAYSIELLRRQRIMRIVNKYTEMPEIF